MRSALFGAKKNAMAIAMAVFIGVPLQKFAVSASVRTMSALVRIMSASVSAI